MIDTKKSLLAASLAALLASAAHAASLPIQWQAVVSPNLRGYRVYYGTSSRNYTASVDVGNTTQYTLTGLANCVRYYVAVKAYSQSGVLSTSYSNEIVGFPTPTVTLVSPSSAEPGQSLTVNVSGANFDNGAALVLPGEINILSSTTQSCNQLTSLISLAGSVSLGTRNAQVRNPDASSGTLVSGFTVFATSVPTIRAASPAPGAVNVAPSVRPSVLFSERMMQSSITSTYVRLLKADGSVVPQAVGSPTLDSTGTVVVIVPAAPLGYATQYRIALTGGSIYGVRDAQGTALAASYLQSPAFQVAAAPPQGPSIPNPGPDAYAAVASADGTVVEFLTPMDPASLTPATVSLIGPGGAIDQAEGSPSLDESRTRATIVPGASLEPGASYRVRVMGGPLGVRDAAGHELRSSYEAEGFLVAAIPSTGEEETEEPDSPSHGDGLWPVDIDPRDRTSDVPAFLRVAVSFNRTLDPLSLSTQVVRLIDPAGAEVPQAPGSPILEATRTIVTIVPAQPLSPSVAYRVEVVGGPEGVRDDHGATMKGTFDQVHGFSVEGPDSDRPALRATDPEDGERKVETGLWPMVTFSQPLDPGSIDATTIELLGADGHAVAQAEGSPFLDGSGTVATIVPAEPLRARAWYRIRVVAGPGGVRDFSGRSMSTTTTSEVRFRTRARARGR